ncbi:hypothetical protein C8J57DRAFT_1517740 [Mycena rebaudengoi]|nr:hypothetical protein C8J57DRAFT_1517740 [Mycena rebaudengoi]
MHVYAPVNATEQGRHKIIRRYALVRMTTSKSSPTSIIDSFHDTFHTYEDTHTMTLDLATQRSLRNTPTNIVDFLAPNDPTYQIWI